MNKENKKGRKKNHLRDGLRRRAMKELGRVTFSPDTTSGDGSPRVSLREKKKFI